jgi:3-oxoacyl-[acyl-carrier protein] reductase
MNKTVKSNALITGGAGGIGMAIAHELARQGVRVFLHDLPESGGFAKAVLLNEQYGAGAATFIPGDLSDPAAVIEESKAWLENFGPFGILVNNAGVDTMGALSGITLETFLHTQRVNADAAFVLCQALAPGMQALGNGAIVNVMSIILSGGWEHRVPYAMSKGSLLGLTRSLARELGPFNIRVNAVSPGAIPTDVERKFWQDDRSELDKFILDRQALKFRATAQDVADAVWFLVSPQSRFITGHELHVNGGWYMG